MRKTENYESAVYHLDSKDEPLVTQHESSVSFHLDIHKPYGFAIVLTPEQIPQVYELLRSLRAVRRSTQNDRNRNTD